MIVDLEPEDIIWLTNLVGDAPSTERSTQVFDRLRSAEYITWTVADTLFNYDELMAIFNVFPRFSSISRKIDEYTTMRMRKDSSPLPTRIIKKIKED